MLYTILFLAIQSLLNYTYYEPHNHLESTGVAVHDMQSIAITHRQGTRAEEFPVQA